MLLEMSFTKEQAEAQLEQLAEEKRWEEIVALCRRMADELHEDPPPLLPDALSQMQLPAYVEKLRAEDTGSSLWLLGVIYWVGVGGVEEDDDEAFRCFSSAADKGHLLSRCQVGFMFSHGEGVEEDEARGYGMMLQTAEAGCPAAFRWLGDACRHGWGVQKSYRRAAQWYLKAETRSHAPDQLKPLINDYPLECAPLGEWRPELTPLVPAPIYQAMRTTMLLCKRFQIPRGVARIIASYVCTDGEQWQLQFPRVKKKSLWWIE